MRLKLEFDDGRVVEGDANPKTFMGMASKSAFKKQFGVPAIVMSVWAQAFDGDGKLSADLPADQLQWLDEEYLAFLVWMELHRRVDDMPDGDWDQIVQRVVGVEVENDVEDPT